MAHSKSHNHSSPNNYRLLSILSKLLENTFMESSFASYLEETQPISNYQWGFQDGQVYSNCLNRNYSQVASYSCLKVGAIFLILRRLLTLSDIRLYFRNFRIWVSAAIYCGGYRATSLESQAKGCS